MDYRHEVWGMNEPAFWTPILPASGLEGLEASGAWHRDGDAVSCQAGDEAAHLFFGDREWRDYELKMLVEPEAGGNVQVPFRLSEDGSRGYMLDLLLGWQAVGISRLEPSVRKLSVVNHRLEHGRQYSVELAVRGASLTSYIDGALVNQVTDFVHEQGRFALSVWNARTRFTSPMARRLG